MHKFFCGDTSYGIVDTIPIVILGVITKMSQPSNTDISQDGSGDQKSIDIPHPHPESPSRPVSQAENERALDGLELTGVLQHSTEWTSPSSLIRLLLKLATFDAKRVVEKSGSSDSVDGSSDDGGVEVTLERNDVLQGAWVLQKHIKVIEDPPHGVPCSQVGDDVGCVRAADDT